MKRSKFSEEQIIAVLREQEAGAKTAGVCRRHGISSPTFYSWKSCYGGMDVSEVTRLKALEEENAKLKQLYADAMLDSEAGERTVRGNVRPPSALNDLLDQKVGSALQLQEPSMAIPAKD